MPEHLIRLRGPWELLDEAAVGPEAIRRIDLPIEILPGSDRPLRLRRRFGRPVRFRPGLACWLRFEDVPGLVQVTLNGEPLATVPGDDVPSIDGSDVPIGSRLLPRNVLELTVAPGPPRQTEAGRPWGAIALVFGPDDGPAG